MSYIKAAILAFILAAIGAGCWAIYSSGLNAGREEIQAKWDSAKAEAQAKQDAQSEKASEMLTQEVEVIRTVYKDRIKEVVKYVPTGTCPADPDFVRLFNAAR